jgi:hypothetical protein
VRSGPVEARRCFFRHLVSYHTVGTSIGLCPSRSDEMLLMDRTSDFCILKSFLWTQAHGVVSLDNILHASSSWLPWKYVTGSSFDARVQPKKAENARRNVGQMNLSELLGQLASSPDIESHDEYGMITIEICTTSVQILLWYEVHRIQLM